MISEIRSKDCESCQKRIFKSRVGYYTESKTGDGPRHYCRVSIGSLYEKLNYIGDEISNLARLMLDIQSQLNKPSC